MKLFLHTPERIRIINDAQTPSEFECTPAQYMSLEPEYPELPDGMTGRYWTPETNYVTDGVQIVWESFDGSAYCQQVSTYRLPCIWAEISLSKDRLRIDDPSDTIVFSAALKDDNGGIVPVEYTWIIRLRDADHAEIDAFEVTFSQGSTGDVIYTCPPGAHLGRIHIDDNDFHPVDVPGVGSFLVKLLTPVKFTIYRQL